ncbi:hypothetical protein BGY98DRAFT_694186 [Russula aff. rugulosa BPL654]|nr:hypothetical protein BGY98DRAFT_694186 [Russula aff. rugulosa BPL654]
MAAVMTALNDVNGRSPSISDLKPGERIGLLLATEASILSCICITIIFVWICRNTHWYKKTFSNSNWKLFRGPADILMFSLFVFDILQAIGGIFNIRWAHNGIVTIGPYCTAQGVIAQIGELGVALITLLLAVHTFVAAVLQVGRLKARGVALSLVRLACVFIKLWVPF